MSEYDDWKKELLDQLEYERTFMEEHTEKRQSISQGIADRFWKCNEYRKNIFRKRKKSSRENTNDERRCIK